MIDNSLFEVTEEEAIFLAKLDDLVYEFLSYCPCLMRRSVYDQVLAKIEQIPHEPKVVSRISDQQLIEAEEWLEDIPQDACSQEILDRITMLIDAKTSEYFLNLKYSQFLSTSYWEWIRQAALRKAGRRCEECRAKKRKLQIHHKTYVHRGKEHLYMEDLQVLCRACHVEKHL